MQNMKDAFAFILYNCIIKAKIAPLSLPLKDAIAFNVENYTPMFSVCQALF